LVKNIIGIVEEHDDSDRFSAEKVSFKSLSSKFTEKYLDYLLKKPFVSIPEWEDRNEILKLYLCLQKLIDAFYDSQDNVSAKSHDKYLKYRYNYVDFSIIIENDFFRTLKVLYKRLRVIAKSGQIPDVNTNFDQDLFSLLSTQLYRSSLTQFEKISYDKTKFYCLTAIFMEANHESKTFTKSLLELVPMAIKSIELEIEEKLEFPLESFLCFNQPGISKEVSREKLIRFLEKVVNGECDNLEIFKHLNKWMIKVYLHLLKFEDMVLFLLSFNSINHRNLYQNQPELQIFKIDSANHIFIKLIEKFQPFSPRINFVKNQNDPSIYGNSTVVSIFYDLFELSNIFSLCRHFAYPSIFDELVETFYYSLLIQFYKLEPVKLLQLALESEYSFQIFVVQVVSELDFSFADFLKFVKKPENYGSKENINLFIRRACLPILNLLRLPLISSDDWELRKTKINLHLDLLSKINLQLKAPIISIEIEKYKYLLDNFSFKDNQIDFQKYQKLYFKILENPSKGILEIALFSHYSFHFINSSKKLPYMGLKFLCRSIILMDDFFTNWGLQIFSLEYNDELFYHAFQIISTIICKKLTIALPNCNLLGKYFTGSKTSLFSKSVTKILRGYADGIIDVNWGVSKRMIKVYLIFVHYDKTVNP
jgi:hypothetical protein